MRMYCRRCYELHTGWITPSQCPACGARMTPLDWLINLPQDRPSRAWELSTQDRGFLRRLKIAQD